MNESVSGVNLDVLGRAYNCVAFLVEKGNWEAQQTHESLRRYLLEECFELFDAISSGVVEDIRDELGDVLLQVFFHSALAFRDEEFSIEDVASGLELKLRERSAPIFAGEVLSVEEQDSYWQSVKAKKADSKHSASTQISSSTDGLKLLGVKRGLASISLVTCLGERLGGFDFPVELYPNLFKVPAFKWFEFGVDDLMFREVLTDFCVQVGNAVLKFNKVPVGNEWFEVWE